MRPPSLGINRSSDELKRLSSSLHCIIAYCSAFIRACSRPPATRGTPTSSKRRGRIDRRAVNQSLHQIQSDKPLPVGLCSKVGFGRFIGPSSLWDQPRSAHAATRHFMLRFKRADEPAIFHFRGTAFPAIHRHILAHSSRHLSVHFHRLSSTFIDRSTTDDDDEDEEELRSKRSTMALSDWSDVGVGYGHSW